MPKYMWPCMGGISDSRSPVKQPPKATRPPRRIIQPIADFWADSSTSFPRRPSENRSLRGGECTAGRRWRRLPDFPIAGMNGRPLRSSRRLARHMPLWLAALSPGGVAGRKRWVSSKGGTSATSAREPGEHVYACNRSRRPCSRVSSASSRRRGE